MQYCHVYLVVESADHFLRNGPDVYSCFMDMCKAFDMDMHKNGTLEKVVKMLLLS